MSNLIITIKRTSMINPNEPSVYVKTATARWVVDVVCFRFHEDKPLQISTVRACVRESACAYALCAFVLTSVPCVCLCACVSVSACVFVGTCDICVCV